MQTHTDKNLQRLAQMLGFTVEENYGCFFFLVFKIKLVWVGGYGFNNEIKIIIVREIL